MMQKQCDYVGVTFAVFAYVFTAFWTLCIFHLILTAIWNFPLRIYAKATGIRLPAWFIRVSKTLELLNPIHWLVEIELFLMDRLLKLFK